MCLCIASQAQTRWFDPIEEGADIHGHGWRELDNTYVRLPDKAENTVRKPLWDLSRNSSGLSLVFRSNAPEIIVKYKVKGGLNMFHMPSTGASGVDLYAIDSEGQQRWCAPAFTPQFSADSIQFTYPDLTYFPDGNKSYEYHLYLPLYNTVEWMKIGIPESSGLTFCKASREKPIVVYGTSIGQGACASRPGNCWVNILQRELEHPLVNLSFSGNGKLEPELFDLLNETDAQLYIIDCIPNMYFKSSPVKELTVDGVHKLREKHDCPILLVEHSGFMNEVTNVSKSAFRRGNNRLREAYAALRQEGVKDLYYLTVEEIDLGMDGMVEGVHPNDLGMRRYADAYEKAIREILHEEWRTFRPCKQNRDPYIWMDRHEQVLEYCGRVKPRIVLIGDSITHYWAGEPECDIIRGKDSWNKLWKKEKVCNLGYGWDRIENVLWRIYHGELDGYEAEKVLILAGTNNLERNTPEEIVAGINEIVEAVAIRQPKAEIYVCGILPRRGRESKVATLNLLLQGCLHTDKAKYIDMTPEFADENGKVIESLFIDGLHPNAEGYKHFASMIRKGMEQ